MTYADIMAYNAILDFEDLHSAALDEYFTPKEA